MLLYFPCSFLKYLHRLTDVALRKRGGKPSLMTPGVCVCFNNPRKGMLASHGEVSWREKLISFPGSPSPLVLVLC